MIIWTWGAPPLPHSFILLPGPATHGSNLPLQHHLVTTAVIQEAFTQLTEEEGGQKKINIVLTIHFPRRPVIPLLSSGWCLNPVSFFWNGVSGFCSLDLMDHMCCVSLEIWDSLLSNACAICRYCIKGRVVVIARICVIAKCQTVLLQGEENVGKKRNYCNNLCPNVQMSLKRMQKIKDLPSDTA